MYYKTLFRYEEYYNTLLEYEWNYVYDNLYKYFTDCICILLNKVSKDY